MSIKNYDYLIVGSGLFGAVFAHEATKMGKKCLVIDKREHTGGNVYTKKIEGINVHYYGAHIFHTSNKKIWEYVNRFVEFNHYINSPIANYKEEIYNLPFNMNTFNKLWGVVTPDQAKQKIEAQVKEAGIKNPSNLEEQAISLVGKDIYEKLIRGYTKKQWGVDPKELPAFIIKRLPVRFTYNNNYFKDRYQGIPMGGYNTIIDKLLEGIDVQLNTDFFNQRGELEKRADTIVYTGMIDQFYEYSQGILEYRSLRFEHETISTKNYQGNAVVNFTEYEIPYTRIIEHKHFEFGTQPNTVITKEYPDAWDLEKEPYYPLNNEKNNLLYRKYRKIADNESHVIFGGRLGNYAYYDMDKVIELALIVSEKELKVP